MENKLWIRIMACLLLGLVLLPGIVACGNTTDPSSEVPSETIPENLVPIVERGQKTKYVVMRSDLDSTSAEKDAAVNIRVAINSGLQTELAIKTDWTKDKNADFSDLKEILVGATNRPESVAAKEALSEKEFVIKMDGNKLVIIGYDADGTFAAAAYFITEILKYDADTKTCSLDKLELPENFSYVGTYEPRPGGTTVNPGNEQIVYLVEKSEGGEPVVRKESTTPKKGEIYLVPTVTYDAASGTYLSNYQSIEIDGDISTFQTADAYSDSLYFRSDAMMCYTSTQSSADSVFPRWLEHADEYTVNMMMAINRDNGVYCQRDPSKISDVQTRKDGSLFVHSGDTNYYMVPTLDWIEYVWEIVGYCMDTYQPDVITFEEPEMWYDSGYSQGFKDEWVRYYNEPWKAQTDSPEAMYKTMELKTFLFKRILSEMASRIKAKNPDTKVHIATHSTLNYASWKITAGLDTYMSLGVIDGVIGQTWSDTANSSVQYKGAGVRDPFLNSYVDYATYLDAVEGTAFYALSDPMADGNYTEAECQVMYRQTLVASVLQPEINRFQMFPWPSRSFLNVSSEYRTAQLNVFNALADLSGKAIQMGTGTTGISFLLSDSISWQRDTNNWCLDTSKALYGIAYPLVNNGIRMSFTSMENLRSVDDLKGVQILIVSYDCQKPKTASVNEVIAEWVRRGGTVLYFAGQDKYEDISSMWWHESGSPLQHLMDEMELGIQVKDLNVTKTEKVTYTGSGTYAGFGKPSFTKSQTQFYTCFEGTNAHPFLTMGGKTVGIDQQVGEGHFVAIGLPAAYLSAQTTGDAFVRDAVTYALQYEDQEYVSTDFLWTKRGDIFAGHAISRNYSIVGKYIDLFDPKLAVLSEVTCEAKDSILLFDYSNLQLNIPRVGYTGGVVKAKTETSDKTVLKYTGPVGTMVSTRYLAPAGVYPQEIKAQDADGVEVAVIAEWDKATRSLLVQTEGQHDGVTVTVTWGSKEVDVSAGYTPHSITVATNSNNEDQEWILSSDAGVTETIRFCDGSRKLVYWFDLNNYPKATFGFEIFQNYILEFSFDRKTWYVIADYSLDHEFTQHGGNMEWVYLKEGLYSQYQGEGDHILYVRLRSTDTSKGWGGSIRKFTISWLEAES